MFEGVFVENIMMHSETRTYPPMPQQTAGFMSGMQSFYKYSLRNSDYPTLSIADEISDGLGNKILPGHYELALTDEHDYLILIQSKVPIAVIPVFRLEIDTSGYEVVHDKKTLKKEKKEELEVAKTNKKRAKVGMRPIDKADEIYQEATMEYNPNGYYVIMYERGDIRAWGAVKE